MTTHSTITTTPTRPTWPALAAIGVGLAAVLTAIGTFWDLTGNDAPSDSKDRFLEYLVTVGIFVIAAAIVFGLVVRTATPANGATRAIILAVLSLLSLVVFWAGLPAVLAAGAASCALLAAPRGSAAKIALGIAGVSTVLAAVMAITG